MKNKRCQVPGCNCTATTFKKGSGVYSGVYLEWKFCHCNHHAIKDISTAEESHISDLVSENDICNPFYILRGINELGKAAG